MLKTSNIFCASILLPSSLIICQSLFWTFSQVAFLSPFPLVLLLGFYLVPSFGTCYSVFLMQDPWAGEPYLGLGPFTPLRELSTIAIIIPFVSCPPRGMGFDYIETLTLLSILFWLLLYIFICKSSLVDSSLFHQWLFCNSCDFGVPVRGGKLRVFLFHDLSQSSINFYSISMDLSILDI